MQTRPGLDSRQSGSILMTVTILLAIGALALISILVAISNYVGISFSAYERERAFQLADAGLRAAIVEMNRGRSGILPLGESTNFFADTRFFDAPVWGFATGVNASTSGVRRVTATGTYGRQAVVVTADVTQQRQAVTIHSLYAHAIYAGNSSGDTNYVLAIGGIGNQADRVLGDVYSGNDIAVSGDARLRLPESFTDADGNGLYDNEDRSDAGVTANHDRPLTRAEFDAYAATVDPALTYPNGRYDPGEAFIDTVGNGVYDAGEGFVDLDGDGVYSFGDPFTDTDGDGEYDPGEPFVDHGNGSYDPGEEFDDLNDNGVWDAGQPGYWEWVRIGFRWRQVWNEGADPEPYEDRGNDTYDLGETFVDRNGVYDPGEEHLDDRNGRYDYGTQATGDIAGMPSPGTGQLPADGNDPEITPPDLDRMYYDRARNGPTPPGSLGDWGHDVDVAAARFDRNGRITDANNPSHIFVKNPTNRDYEPIPGKNDYFLEDPTDPSYGKSSQSITVRDNGNEKVYYVNGNVYIHNPHTYDFRFREPGVRITIVANGNITISDEFLYNGGAENPLDSLALIAMKDPTVENSGNIYLGDAQFGTGGDVHAMLYAENNFIDNNLDTQGQPYLKVFGNMTAGNQVDLNRTGPRRTRLDVTLDERIVDLRDLPPGLPQALGGQRSITTAGAWTVVQGTWHTHSPLL